MMKKRIILILAVFVCLFACVFAVMASADNEPALEIKAYNLTYGNSVYISYAVNCENIPSDAKVQLLVWDKPQEEYIKGAEKYSSYTNGKTATVNGTKCQVFVFDKIIARQMAVDFYAVAYVKTADGEYYSAPTKYSVLQYVYNKLGYTGTASNDEVYKSLLVETLKYGAAAQRYFAKEDTRLADAQFYQVVVNGGTLSDGFSKGLYLEGDVLTLTAPETNMSGAMFSHWIDSAGNIVGSEENYTFIVQDHFETYTAVFVSRETEYRFNTDGGSDVESITTASPLTYAPVAEKAGYTFCGWYDNESLSGAPISFPYYRGEDVTLYASWTPNVYSLTLDDSKRNGGTVVTMDVVYGEYVELPKLEREGYIFKGWYINTDKVTDGVWNYAEDIVLVAKWIANVDGGGIITPVHPWV